MWKHAPRTADSRHNLIFVTDGVLYIEQDGTRYEVREGECIFLRQGIPSRGYRPSAVNTGFYYVMFNCPRDLPLFPCHFTLEDAAAVRDCFAWLVSRIGCGDYPAAAMDSLMQSLFYEVIYQSSPHAMQTTSLAKSIKAYVRASIHRNITVNDIALHFDLSAEYVSRLFYRAEHVHLKKYVYEQRVRRIEEYLSTASHPLATTAEIMGFHSASAMCKFYKYHKGISPSEYRRRFFAPDPTASQ